MDKLKICFVLEILKKMFVICWFYYNSTIEWVFHLTIICSQWPYCVTKACYQRACFNWTLYNIFCLSIAILRQNWFYMLVIDFIYKSPVSIWLLTEVLEPQIYIVNQLKLKFEWILHELNIYFNELLNVGNTWN